MLQGRWIDKNFFWGVAFTIKPEWSDKYCGICINQREMNPKLIQPKKVISIF